MAVVVTDNRTIASEADSTTGWTGSATPTLFTADPDPVESTGCLGMAVSTATQHIYFTMGAPVNMSAGVLVYVWVLPRGAMDTTANGGVTLLLGDGTNRIGFHLAGSDKAAFRHDDGPVAWQCLVLDTANLPALSTAYAGSLGALNLGAITQIGAGFKTLAKSTGGVANCFIDVIRYGNGGLTITGGSEGDPGTFAQIAAEDRSTATLKGLGIIRQLGAGVYGLQGPLTFGSTATAATFFKDTNATVVFEDRGLGADKLKITVQGNATGSTTFQLGNKVGSGDTANGSDGCIIQAPGAVSAEFVATSSALQSLKIYGSTLSGFRTGFALSADATNGPNHEFIGNTVRNCARVDLGRVQTRNCTFTGFTGTTAALLWNENIDIKNCVFSTNTDGTNDPAAIEHPSDVGSPYTYNNLTFSANDFDVSNTSGSPITIAKVDGSDPATFKGSSVTFTASFVLTLSGLVSGTQVTIVNSSTRTELQNSTAGVTGIVTYTHSGGETVDILLKHLDYDPNLSDVYDFSLPNADSEIVFQQIDDPNYENPA